MAQASFWDRYTTARVNRRRVLQSMGALSAAAGAIALVGCSGSDDTSSVAGTATTPTRPDQPDILNPLNPPVPGGTYVTANSAAFGSWDPHTGIAVASAYFPRIYNLLLSQSPTKPEYMYMDLAESYEIPDDLTYVFKIRPGVKIAPNSLGVPERDIDGEDVRVTFDRIKTDPLANQYSFASKYVESVTVNGDSVTVRTTEPYAWFLPRMSAYNNTIPPRELVAHPSQFVDAGVGAGPYTLVSVTENDTASFHRNTNFYGRDAANNNAPLPYIDDLEVRVIFDRAPQQTAFLDGQTHQYWAETGQEAEQYAGYPIAREPVFAFIAFTMNPLKEPFTDPRVRRAISRAINRQQYVDLIYGGDARPNGLVHWPLGSYALPDEELASTYQPFNLEEARSLVEEVGGIKFKMMYPANTTIQEHTQHLSIFVQQMREANIQVEEVPLEFTNWITGYQQIDYDSSLALNQIYETPELPLLFHTTGGPFSDRTYIQGLGDAEIDAAVAKANTQLDADARLEAVHDAQKLIYSKDPSFLPLVGPYLHMVYSKKLHNIPAGIGTTSYSLANYWLEA